jgi:hypothetical protein
MTVSNSSPMTTVFRIISEMLITMPAAIPPRSTRPQLMRPMAFCSWWEFQTNPASVDRTLKGRFTRVKQFAALSFEDCIAGLRVGAAVRRRMAEMSRLRSSRAGPGGLRLSTLSTAILHNEQA